MEMPTYNQIETFCSKYFEDLQACFADPAKLAAMARYLAPDLEAEVRQFTVPGLTKSYLRGRQSYLDFLKDSGQEFDMETSLRYIAIDERKVALGVVLEIRRLERKTGTRYNLSGYGAFQLSYGADKELKIKRLSLYEC